MCIVLYLTSLYTVELHIIYGCFSDFQDTCPTPKLNFEKQNRKPFCFFKWENNQYSLSGSLFWETWKYLEILALVSVDLTAIGQRGLHSTGECIITVFTHIDWNFAHIERNCSSPLAFKNQTNNTPSCLPPAKKKIIWYYLGIWKQGSKLTKISEFLCLFVNIRVLVIILHLTVVICMLCGYAHS